MGARPAVDDEGEAELIGDTDGGPDIVGESASTRAGISLRRTLASASVAAFRGILADDSGRARESRAPARVLRIREATAMRDEGDRTPSPKVMSTLAGSRRTVTSEGSGVFDRACPPVAWRSRI
jgi:hypothetical protein